MRRYKLVFTIYITDEQIKEAINDDMNSIRTKIIDKFKNMKKCFECGIYLDKPAYYSKINKWSFCKECAKPMLAGKQKAKVEFHQWLEEIGE